MKNVLTLLAVLAVSACATTPVDTIRAKNIAPDRILAYAEPRDDYAKVEIIRDVGFTGGGCYIGVMFRNTVLARFDQGEKAVFYLPDGNWKFAVVPDPAGRGLCGIGGYDPVFETQSIRKDQDNLFRISLGPYRRPRLLPM